MKWAALPSSLYVCAHMWFGDSLYITICYTGLFSFLKVPTIAYVQLKRDFPSSSHSKPIKSEANMTETNAVLVLAQHCIL